MSEIAPPSPARSGGATSPHCGIVPRPAAPHPQPAGELCAGLSCVSSQTSPAGRQLGRGLSRTEASRAKADALREVMQREDCTINEAARRLGLNERHAHKLTKRWGIKPNPEASARARAAIIAKLSPEQQQRGLARSKEVLRGYRDRVAAEAEQRRERIKAAALDRPHLTQSQLAKAIGETLSAVQKALAVPRSQANYIGAFHIEQAKRARERRAHIAAVMRADLDAGLTKREAIEKHGFSRNLAHEVCTAYGLTPKKSAVKAALQRAGVKGAQKRQLAPKPPKAADVRAEPAGPNPRLSAAQQAQVDRMRNRFWVRTRADLMALPPPTRDEADALVQQFLARGGKVTVSEPAAPVVVPCNAGASWAMVGRRR